MVNLFHSRPRRRHRAETSRRPVPREGSPRRLLVVVPFSALLLLSAIGGGSAFADTLSLLYLRPAAVLALLVMLLSRTPADWAIVRMPLILLAALAAIMMLQLVPLPPSIWPMLGGRSPYVQVAKLVGLPQPWRPLSLTPDLTANSLAALVLPCAVLVGFAKLHEEQRRRLAGALVALCCASAAWGVAQFASGSASALYLYARTHNGFPVGLLANRNHQAVLLALTFPALAVWSSRPTLTSSAARRRQWIALTSGILIVPVVLATGSRAGMVITAATIATTLFVFGLRPWTADARAGRLLRYGVPFVIVLAVVASYAGGRAYSIERLASIAAIESDNRVQFAPVVVGIVRTTFPAGTGFGSFDPVFRQYEPDSDLDAAYFNHAHNDLLELIMTGGLPGLLVLIAFLIWWAQRLASAIRARERSEYRHFNLLGGIAIAALMGASLVDYPLRPPLLSAVLAVCCGWLAPRPTLSRESRQGSGELPERARTGMPADEKPRSGVGVLQ